MLDINLTNEQFVELTLKPTSGKGKPQTLDGDPTFESDNEDTTVEYDPATKIATITPPDDLVGDRTISFSADADLSDGTDTIEDSITLHVRNPQATTLGATAVAKDKP